MKFQNRVRYPLSAKSRIERRISKPRALAATSGFSGWTSGLSYACGIFMVCSGLIYSLRFTFFSFSFPDAFNSLLLFLLGLIVIYIASHDNFVSKKLNDMGYGVPQKIEED